MYKSICDNLRPVFKHHLHKFKLEHKRYSSCSEQLERRSETNKLDILLNPNICQKNEQLKTTYPAFKKTKAYLHQILLNKLVDPLFHRITPKVKRMKHLTKLCDFRTHHGYLDGTEETEIDNCLRCVEGEPRPFKFNMAMEVDNYIVRPCGGFNKVKSTCRTFYADLQNFYTSLILKRLVFDKIHKLVPGLNDEDLSCFYDFRVHSENQYQNCADVEVTRVNKFGEKTILTSVSLNTDGQSGNKIDINRNLNLPHYTKNNNTHNVNNNETTKTVGKSPVQCATQIAQNTITASSSTQNSDAEFNKAQECTKEFIETKKNSKDVSIVENCLKLEYIITTPHVLELHDTVNIEKEKGNQIHQLKSPADSSESNTSEDNVKTVLVSLETSGEEARFVKREQLVGNELKSELVDYNMVVESENKRTSAERGEVNYVEDTKPIKPIPVNKGSFLAEKAKLKPWTRRTDALISKNNNRQQNDSITTSKLPKSPVATAVEDGEMFKKNESDDNFDLSEQMPSKNTDSNFIAKNESFEIIKDTPKENRNEKPIKALKNHNSNEVQRNLSSNFQDASDKQPLELKNKGGNKVLRIVRKNTDSNFIAKDESFEIIKDTPKEDQNEKPIKAFKNNNLNEVQINVSSNFQDASDKQPLKLKNKGVNEELQSVRKAQIKTREEVQHQKTKYKSVIIGENSTTQQSVSNNFKENPKLITDRLLDKKGFVKLNSPIKISENRVKMLALKKEAQKNENDHNSEKHGNIQGTEGRRRSTENVLKSHEINNKKMLSVTPAKEKIKEESELQQKSNTLLKHKSSSIETQNLKNLQVGSKRLQPSKTNDSHNIGKLSNKQTKLFKSEGNLNSLNNKGAQTKNVNDLREAEKPKTASKTDKKAGVTDIQNNRQNISVIKRSTHKIPMPIISTLNESVSKDKILQKRSKIK